MLLRVENVWARGRSDLAVVLRGWVDSLLQLHQALEDVISDGFVGAGILVWRLLCGLLVLLLLLNL